MNLAGKPLSQYFVASRKFLGIIFCIMAIVVMLRLSGNDLSILNALNLLGVAVIGWAGWSAKRTYGMNLRQAWIVGFILSFGTHWALVIFHGAPEILFLFVTNTVLYLIISTLGWCLAKWFGR